MKNWPLKVFILSFVLAAIFSGLSNFCADMNVTILILILLLVILIGILFDMIGVAVLTSKEVTFHAMSSKKIREQRNPFLYCETAMWFLVYVMMLLEIFVEL